MAMWRIGCSGYHYAEWKGLFYPEALPKSKWFDFYCSHFNTIELNVTFYKFPRVEYLKSWFHRCPENFNFSVKAPRLITHYKRFKDAQRLLQDFYGSIRQGLGHKLGCVLFQFPSSFAFAEDHLERIVGLLDQSFVNVVEFRDRSWWQHEVYRTFADRHIAFCGMSHPDLPQDVMKTTDVVYYRFHGVPHLYASLYEPQSLEQLVHSIQQNGPHREVFMYFNNTATGAAITNAHQLQEISEPVHR